jgi:hypothetical protein
VIAAERMTLATLWLADAAERMERAIARERALRAKRRAERFDASDLAFFRSPLKGAF